MENESPALTAVREKITAVYESRGNGNFSPEELAQYVVLIDQERRLLASGSVDPPAPGHDDLALFRSLQGFGG